MPASLPNACGNCTNYGEKTLDIGRIRQHTSGNANKESKVTISKFDLGPSVTISMTQELLALLSRAAGDHECADQEEVQALMNFRQLADQTLSYCAEHPDNKGVVHGFCL